MKHSKLTGCIYLSAAVASSGFVATQGLEAGTRSEGLPSWLIFFAIPLLFVFAYPRFLFVASSRPANRWCFAAITSGVGLVVTTYLFVYFALPFWENPLRDVQSLKILLVPLVVLPVLLVAAVSLLIKNKSSLATFGCLMLWPYWLMVALVSLNRSFDESLFYTTLYFLCFLSPALFAFAAGAVSYRPVLAHLFTVSGLVGVPWLYRAITTDFEIYNLWTMFNVPDRDSGAYPLVHAQLTILAVGLVALALVTATFRLLPVHWAFRSSPLRDRTWPAFAVSILVLTIWFGQSVMPYRIPGALDYSSWPVLQILHVEKRGLQFHEASFSVWSVRVTPTSFLLPPSDLICLSSRNDRRLFEYRFQRKTASVFLTQPLAQRVQAIIHSSDFAKQNPESVSPLRAWNAEGWYVFVGSSGLVSYTTEKGNSVPQEVVDLFHDLEGTSRSEKLTITDTKDVCLGFCYDPPAELGSLYANQRCFNQGRGYICR